MSAIYRKRLRYIVSVCVTTQRFAFYLKGLRYLAKVCIILQRFSLSCVALIRFHNTTSKSWYCLGFNMQMVWHYSYTRHLFWFVFWQHAWGMIFTPITKQHVHEHPICLNSTCEDELSIFVLFKYINNYIMLIDQIT